MSRARTWALAAGALAALAGAPSALRAQLAPSVEVVRPAPGEVLRSATPTFTVVARNVVPPAGGTVWVEIQVSPSAGFGAPLLYAGTAQGDSADFVPPRPLPSGIPVYWRAIARVDGDRVATSAITGPVTSAIWLAIVEPDAPNGVVLDTRRPRFVWRSAGVAIPPGPWRYDLTIINVATGRRTTTAGLLDTVFVPASDLEANTSYRWSVKAYLPTGDSTRVTSQGSFVITSPEQPLATLLYQNFPNPFPSPSAATTCVWFDLAQPASVELEVLTLRGERVRTIYPGPGDAGVLRAGRYGRADVGSNTGCDARFTWDGRSETGDRVTPGVYLLRLRAGRMVSVRKVVFRGR